MLFQGWVIFFNNICAPFATLFHFLPSSKPLDSFPKLNENHILSILQLPNKFNSQVRVLLVKTVRALGLINLD